MLNKYKTIIYSMLVFVAVSTYVILNSNSESKAIHKADLGEVDFATLSESDIDVIEAVKEKMQAVVPSAHAADQPND